MRLACPGPKRGRRRRRRRRRRVEFTWLCSWMVAMQQTSANTVSNVWPQQQGFNILSHLKSSHPLNISLALSHSHTLTPTSPLLLTLL
jgi:hypothetical protein